MRDLSRRVVFVLLTLAAAGCGGGGRPSTPSVLPSAAPSPAPTPTPVATGGTVIRDGWTEEEVAVSTSPASPGTGTNVVVEAPGYLRREQRFNGSPIFLWPSEESYVRTLVYDWEFTDGSLRMIRWPQPFTLSFDGDLANDAAIQAKAAEVVAEITRITGLPITIAPGGGNVTVRINPSILDEGAIAQTLITFRGASITEATVEFANRQEISGGSGSQYRNTLLHEMGHVMGLNHSASDRDVMTPAEGPGTREGNYQTDEATCLHMMYAHRQAGNFFPDRDAALGAASTQTRTVRIVN